MSCSEYYGNSRIIQGMNQLVREVNRNLNAQIKIVQN